MKGVATGGAFHVFDLPIGLRYACGVTPHYPYIMSSAVTLQTSPAPIRSARRYRCLALADLSIVGLGRAQLICSNVSAVGAFFETTALLDEGTRVHCRIPLPDGQWLVVPGHVVRVDEATTPGVGIRFAATTENISAKLAIAFNGVAKPPPTY